MTDSEMVEAIKFVVSDIGREILLAKADRPLEKNILRLVGIHPGGGNWLAAVGLMVYTEAFGKIISGKENKAAFNCFLEKIYGKKFVSKLDADLQNHKIYLKPSIKNQTSTYDVFRCGMAHEYWMKGEGQVYMFGSQDAGIGIGKGRPFIIVAIYYKDMCTALENNFENNYKVAFDQLSDEIKNLIRSL